MSLVAGYELADLLALRELSRTDLRARFGALETDRKVGYAGIVHVDRLHAAAAFPGSFYFRGDAFVMLHLARSALEDAGPGALERALGKPAAKLSSHTGENSSLLVYPDRGVAFSTDGEHVEFLEVFPPTTLKAYTAGIYDPRGDVIR